MNIKNNIKSPTGNKLNCKGWHQEAAYRMLQNNLDPSVAENPDKLIVYGGIGKAARNWESYHKILDCLGDLMLAGHRIFGHIKTSQGGHQLTNLLLREFLSNKSNWQIENFKDKKKDHKDSTYLRPFAVNA